MPAREQREAMLCYVTSYAATGFDASHAFGKRSHHKTHAYTFVVWRDPEALCFHQSKGRAANRRWSAARLLDLAQAT
jgi:hypothetical protein